MKSIGIFKSLFLMLVMALFCMTATARPGRVHTVNRSRVVMMAKVKHCPCKKHHKKCKKHRHCKKHHCFCVRYSHPMNHRR